jgi:hypothetical protein
MTLLRSLHAHSRFFATCRGQAGPWLSSSLRRQKQRSGIRLQLEQLEARCVPTIYRPTTFADGELGSGSLRDATLQANADLGTADDFILCKLGLIT